MARFYRDSDDRLDDQIRAAEEKLDGLYRKRAGRRNYRESGPVYGWIYCDCGRRNLTEGSGNDCEHCARKSSEARALATLEAHDSGMHAITPDADCISCYAARHAL